MPEANCVTHAQEPKFCQGRPANHQPPPYTRGNRPFFGQFLASYSLTVERNGNTVLTEPVEGQATGVVVDDHLWVSFVIALNWRNFPKLKLAKILGHPNEFHFSLEDRGLDSYHRTSGNSISEPPTMFKCRTTMGSSVCRHATPKQT